MKKTIFFLSISVMLLTSLFVEGQPLRENPGAANEEDVITELYKFNQFYEYLNKYYMDTVNNHILIESAITEMLEKLDPHSMYLTAEEMAGVTEVFDASFSGIGVEYNVLRDTVLVVNVIAGGPSDKVGIRPNDRIISVNGENIIGIKQADVPKKLRGPRGSKAEMQIWRAGEEKLLDFVVVRDNIPLHTVDAAYKIDQRTGYIRISRFAATTFAEFKEAFARLDGIDGLIVDIRGNGGGIMDQGVNLSGFFLPAGSLIVSAQGLKMPPRRDKALVDGPFTQGRLVVLVDESSASASEIFAGAMQDWDRGIIIGYPTFGKGLVQSQIPLLDGSGVRLTIARYFTPSGRAIQRPYTLGDKETYYKDLIDQINEDSFRVDSSKVYTTLRTGRTVYGGGGIIPDIIIHRDTTRYTDYWSDLIRKGVVSEFVYDYISANRAKLEQRYPDPDSFIQGFEMDSAIMNSLESFARTKGVPQNDERSAGAERQLKKYFKALVAQKLWGVNELYMILNTTDDEVYAKAVEVMGDWERYSNEILYP